MDPNLHQKQGIHHLNRVLNYAPFVAEGRTASVFLTVEDWHVVADTLFHMQTPREVLPSAITQYSLSDDQQSISLVTDSLDITLEMT